MNKDQVKGRVKEVVGKVQKHMGKDNCDTDAEAKGAMRETEGKIQKTFGDIKHKVAKAIDR